MAKVSHYNIRSLTLADEPFLWEMLYLAIYVPEGSPPVPRGILNTPEIARYAQFWGRNGDFGFIASDIETSQPIGAAWVRLFTEADKGYGYVAHDIPELTMAVLPEYRGKGVGTQLLMALIAAIDDKGTTISLSVDPGNPAIALYERFGFRTIGESGTSLVMLREKQRSKN